MKISEPMNYRQWQKRNTENFNSLLKSQKKEARQQGYYNRGWKQVQISWDIICKLRKNVFSLFEHKLNQADLVGAIKQSILEAERGKCLAHLALETLERTQKDLDKVADETLAKYPLL